MLSGPPDARYASEGRTELSYGRERNSLDEDIGQPFMLILRSRVSADVVLVIDSDLVLLVIDSDVRIRRI